MTPPILFAMMRGAWRLAAILAALLLAGCADGRVDVFRLGDAGGSGQEKDGECPQAPPLPEDPQMAELVSWFEDHMEEHHVPGAALVVVHGEDTFVATRGGVREGGCPITDDTRFALGGMSRVVTNLAVLAEMRAEGVSLDSPVAEHLDAVPVEENDRYPEFGGADDITIRHLLSWTAGIPGESGFIRRVKCDETLAAWAHGPESEGGEPFELMSPPGKLTGFSPSDVMLLARLLEKRRDQDFAEAVRDLVFVPLGMDTAQVNEPDPDVAPIAHPHEWRGGLRHRPPEGFFGCESSAPYMLAWLSADDGARLLELFVNREPMGVLPPGDLESFADAGGAGDPRYGSVRMGYGFRSHDDGLLGRTVNFVATGPGYTASLEYYPDESFGYFYMLNVVRQEHPATDASYERKRKIVQHFFPDRDLRDCFCRFDSDCRVKNAVSCTAPGKLMRSRSEWAARYAGTYAPTASVAPPEIDVSFEGDDLLIDGTVAVPIGLDAFTVHRGPYDRETLAFTADESGEPRWLVRGTGSNNVYVHRSSE